ncbi:MAG: NUDIX hydrolase [Oscillospiraceae bacterium]|nr:NUDIX hydrolase [Oscillospiraceae bacterium]
MNLEEKQLSSKNIYDGCLLHVRRDEVLLPNGGQSVREYLIHNGAVCIIPLTEQGGVLIEHQFRYATGQTVVELPAGKLDSPDEDPLAAAQRELREETGALAEIWVPLGYFYPAVAYSTEKIYLFAAKHLTFGARALDADEFLEVEEVPLETLVKQVLAGQILDIKTQAAVLRAHLMRQDGAL